VKRDRRVSGTSGKTRPRGRIRPRAPERYWLVNVPAVVVPDVPLRMSSRREPGARPPLEGWRGQHVRRKSERPAKGGEAGRSREGSRSKRRVAACGSGRRRSSLRRPSSPWKGRTLRTVARPSLERVTTVGDGETGRPASVPLASVVHDVGREMGSVFVHTARGAQHDRAKPRHCGVRRTRARVRLRVPAAQSILIATCLSCVYSSIE
jgi:hypothetical protein